MNAETPAEVVEDAAFEEEVLEEALVDVVDVEVLTTDEELELFVDEVVVEDLVVVTKVEPAVAVAPVVAVPGTHWK